MAMRVCIFAMMVTAAVGRMHPDDIVSEMPMESSVTAIPEMEFAAFPKVSVDSIQPAKRYKSASAAAKDFLVQTDAYLGSGSGAQPGEPLAPPDNAPGEAEAEQDTPFWKNLAAAKAYSILAKDKIQDVLDENDHFMSAGRYFFAGFAEDGFTPDEAKMYRMALRASKKEEALRPPKIDLEDQYRRLMVNIWKNHSEGWGDGSLGPYVLKHFDKALRSEEGMVETRGMYVYPTNDAFGMTDDNFLGNVGNMGQLGMEPSTMDRIRVPLHEYEAKYAEVSSEYYVKNADVEDKLEKLHHEIEPFYQVPNSTRDAQDEKILDELEHLKEETEGKEEDDDSPAPPPMVMPKPGEKISVVMEITTGEEENMGSTMKPNVTFVTSTGARFGPYAFTTQLPPAGASDLVSFCTEQDAANVKSFGQVSSVELTATGEDPWFFQKIKVRVAGAFLPWVNFKAGNWLDQKFTQPNDNEEQNIMHAAKFDLLPAPEEPEEPEKPKTPWNLSVRAKTGDIALGKASTPKITVVGETGQAEVKFSPAGKGESNEEITPIAEIGGIEHISVTATGAEPWFFTSFEVKLNDGEWTPYGPGRVFLQVGAEGDFHGYPHAEEITLVKKLSVCSIRTTTGNFKNSATDTKPKVTIVGEKGSESFHLSPGGKGKTITEATPVSDALGEIQSVKLEATGTSEWNFDTFDIKMNHNAWGPFGSTHQYLDSVPNKDKSSYHMQPHGASLTLTPEIDTVSVTVATGYAKGAATKDKPRLIIHGSKGRKVLDLETAAVGKEATTTSKTVELGDLHSVVLEASGGDEWFVTSLQININNGTSTSFGHLPLWLVSMPNGDDEMYKGAKSTERTKLHPVSHLLGIKATTGERPQAGTGSWPKVTITGKEGKYTTVFYPGDTGKEKLTMLTTPPIGEVTSVVLHASSTDEWFFTDFNVKTDERDWAGYGPTHQWLQKEPFHKDLDTYSGHKYGAEIALQPRAFKTVIKVTTAFLYGAESEASVTMVLKGDLGTSSPFQLTDLPKQGSTKEFEFTTIGLGKILMVHLTSSDTDGWAYSKFQIQQGQDAKFVEFGPAHQWVVGKNNGKYIGGPKQFSFYHYADELQLTPAIRDFYLRYGTAAMEKHANNQHPRITFIGTLCNNTFVIPTTPEPGTTYVHEFLLTDIGKFIGILLKSSSDDPWLVEHLAYREVLQKEDENKEDQSEKLDDEYHYLSLNDELNAREPYIIQEDVAKAPPSPQYIKKEGQWCNVEPADTEAELGQQRVATTDVCQGLCDEHSECVAFGKHGDKCSLFTKCHAQAWSSEVATASVFLKVVDQETGKTTAADLLQESASTGMMNASDTLEADGISNALLPRTVHDAQQWVDLGSTEFISNDPEKTEKELPVELKAFAVEDAELARPITVGCHCTGKEINVEPALTKYVQGKVGGVCSYHLAEDQKPWCYVSAQCSGRSLSKFSPLLWTYCPEADAVVPVAINLKIGAKAGNSGKIKFKAIGEKDGASAEVLVPSKDVVAGKWVSVYTNVPRSIGEIKHLQIQYDGDDHFEWDDLHMQYGGGFAHSFTRDKKIGGGDNSWMDLHHVAPPKPGNGKIKYLVKDAQSTDRLGGVSYTLLTPRLLGIPADVITAKLDLLKKDIAEAQENKAEQTPEQQAKAVEDVVMGLGGRPMGKAAKFNPVGFDKKKQDSPGWCKFEGVSEHDDHLMLMFVPGYLFTFDRVKTKGTGVVKKRTFMAKNMEHGQMLITLSWDQNPHDLDLYVVAPGKHGDTEIGGGKPGEPSPPPVPGISVNWMNMGSPDTYPYTVLDADATYGFGPETTSVHKPVTGKYKIHVDCYSCWSEDDYDTFFKSDATVRVFDRMGLKEEFKIAKAKGKPGKFWRVADRTCTAPPPMDGKETEKGFANRDNTWTFQVHSVFQEEEPV
jgi:hypothetical protein